jgi:hypothetical protein
MFEINKSGFCHEYPEATHKPRVRFSSSLKCYVCYDGGLKLYGETAQDAINELSSCRK